MPRVVWPISQTTFFFKPWGLMMMFRRKRISSAAVEIRCKTTRVMLRIKDGTPVWRAITVVCLGFGFITPAVAASLDRPLSVQGQAQQEAVQSQGKIDKLADQTSDMAVRYRSILAELDNARIYNDQLEKLVESQQQEALSIEQQLKNIDVTERQILPFIQRMLTTLDEFVRLDVPFLPDERQSRLQQLHLMMDDATVSIAEKYRRVMEAYQIETDYGRNIEAYRGNLSQHGSERLVDFLRVGRVALLYRALDGSDSGYWDQRQHQWVSMGGEYTHAVADGLRIARKEAAPDLIDVPVPAPESAHD